MKLFLKNLIRKIRRHPLYNGVYALLFSPYKGQYVVFIEEDKNYYHFLDLSTLKNIKFFKSDFTLRIFRKDVDLISVLINRYWIVIKEQFEKK